MSRSDGDRTIRVALIGFGAIGRSIAAAIADGRAGDTELVSVLVRNPRKVGEAAGAFEVASRFDAVAAAHPDVIVEVAGHTALREYAAAVLGAGADLVTLSSGAFADAELLERTRAAARASRRRILVPSGAIAAIDAIGAAALGELDEVVHTVRKPPAAFTPAQLDTPIALDAARLLFDGPVREGAHRFPENVNVAATVALAGIGFDRTVLRVYADPSLTRNTHELRLHGYFGRLAVVMENTPSDNPKTGRIVALSVVKTLRDRTAPIVLGA